MSDVQLLIVDDNVDLAENLAEILEDEGFTCEVADSAQTALGRLAEHRFDLVITDMKMDGMDGLGLLREINRRWSQTPVVIMTAYARDAQVDAARREGALDILAKPLDAASLLQLAERFADEGPKNLLIVEDDDDLRDNLVEIMTGLGGVEVREASSLEAARACLAEETFDMAIIDIRLPDGNGLEFAKAVRASLGDRCPRIVFMTAHGHQLATTVRALALEPPAKMLHKPFPPSVLIAVVREAV